MSFDDIPHSQRLLSAVEKLEASGQIIPPMEGAAANDAIQALKSENDALKERQQKIVQRIDRLIQTLEKSA